MRGRGDQRRLAAQLRTAAAGVAESQYLSLDRIADRPHGGDDQLSVCLPVKYRYTVA